MVQMLINLKSAIALLKNFSDVKLVYKDGERVHQILRAITSFTLKEYKKDLGVTHQVFVLYLEVIVEMNWVKLTNGFNTFYEQPVIFFFREPSRRKKAHPIVNIKTDVLEIRPSPTFFDIFKNPPIPPHPQNSRRKQLYKKFLEYQKVSINSLEVDSFLLLSYIYVKYRCRYL